MWIPPEDKDPSVLQYPTRKGMSVFGAVNIRTGEFAGMMSDVFNAITFLRFLTVLMKRGEGERAYYYRGLFTTTDFSVLLIATF